MQGHLMCPQCGGSYTHLRAVHAFQDNDSGRMDGSLRFDCEEGHVFIVAFAQRKGETEVHVEVRP